MATRFTSSAESPRHAALPEARETGTAEVVDPISLVLIDDNRLLREGLAAMINGQPGFSVLATAAEAGDALRKVRALRPRVVLVDHELTSGDTLSLTASIHREVPSTRVIVMGLSPLRVEVADYVLAGASGFILKGASFEEFSKTIQAVASGAEVLPEALSHTLFTEFSRRAAPHGEVRRAGEVPLTPREHEIVLLLEEGMSNKQIALRLHIAVHTVKSHMHNILEKFGLNSRLEVVALTSGPGWLKPPQH